MTAKNIGELFGVTNRNGHRGNAAMLRSRAIMMGLQRSSKDGNKVAFSIGLELMKMMRWVTGDRVTIDIDTDCGCVTLRRVVHGGSVEEPSWCLSCRAALKGDARIGKTVPSTVRVKTTPELLDALCIKEGDPHYITEDVVCDGNGLTFSLPHKQTLLQVRATRRTG